MYPLVIGIGLALGLVVIPIISKSLLEEAKDQYSEKKWLMEHGIRVDARIIQVQTMQGWKYGERLCRDPWTGDLTHERTWQTYYEVTAQWVHSQTGHTYISSTRIWSDDCTSKPIEGGSGAVWFDPNTPERSCLDLQSSWDGIL